MPRASSPAPADYGPSNGHSRDSGVTGCSIDACGLDTVSFAWRPDDPDWWGDLLAAARRGSLTSFGDDGRAISSEIAPSARRSYLFRSPIGGGRFGFFPDHQLVYCEGRAASLFVGKPAPPTLLDHRLLSHAATRAALEFEQLGLPLLFEPALVRRLDLAVEVVFADPTEGVRFMHALSGIPLPRLKTDVWLKDGRVETIYYRTMGRGEIRFRVYDKGVESQTAEPGGRIRLERQLRYPKADQLAPESPGHLRPGPDLGGRTPCLGPGHRSGSAIGAGSRSGGCRRGCKIRPSRARS